MVPVGFLSIVGFFLAAEHTVHLFGALPYVLVAAVLLLHVLHRSHGSGGSGRGGHGDGGAPP